MKRLLVGVVLGALAVAGLPALADHISEPTHPIDKLTMFVGDYASGTSVGPCSNGAIGTWPSQFERMRMNGYITSSKRQPGGTRPGGEPSEHFDVEQHVNYPWDVSRQKGPGYFADAWEHQNLGPHSPERVRITRVDINVGDKPGFWRIFLRVTGNESGRVLTEECVFEVK